MTKILLMAIGKSVSDGKDRDNIEMQGLPDAVGFLVKWNAMPGLHLGSKE